MSLPAGLLDGLLALLLVILAVRALIAPTLYQCAVAFISFGLTLSLAWARLAAPDVALAEAAIGAGLLGVLLINSLRDFSRGGDDASAIFGKDLPTALFSRTVISCGTLAFAAVLGMAMFHMPEGGGLTALTEASLPHSGVEHPVTAVLLNYRSYDTWLEIGVLVVAMLAIFCAGGFEGFRRPEQGPDSDPVIESLARLLAPLMVMVAGYLLWLGKAYPGGAFQAGVVLAAAGIILQLAGWQIIENLSTWAWKWGLGIGFFFFLALAVSFMPLGLGFFEYPEAWAGPLILVVEVLATLSIGLTLTCFFVYFNGMGASESRRRTR